MTSISRLAIALLLAGAGSLAGAQGTDELWEMTMSMQSEGMTMPPMTQKICKKKGSMDQDKAPMEKDCKLTDSKRSGNKQSFSFVCEGKSGKYGGSGETETLGKDAYRGWMKSSGVREGEKFDMSSDFSGKRIGNCTWEEPGKQVRDIQAQSNAMIAKECDKQIEALEPMMIFGGANLPPEALMCKERAKDFCARVDRVKLQMREPSGFAAADEKYPNWPDAMKACGTDPATVSGPVCKASAGKKDWKFMVAHCESETAALRKAHCDGRTHDTVDAAYKELCVETGGLSYSSQAPDAAKAQPADKPAEAAKPGATDKLKEGAGKLKKFLKF